MQCSRTTTKTSKSTDGERKMAEYKESRVILTALPPPTTANAIKTDVVGVMTVLKAHIEEKNHELS
jgi:hypothetical protein